MDPALYFPQLQPVHPRLDPNKMMYKGIVTLSGPENFIMWRAQFLCQATEKNWTTTVLINPPPTIAGGADQADIDQWMGLNNSCHVMIMWTIKPELFLEFQATPLAKTIWDRTAITYGRAGPQHRYYLLNELMKIELGPTEEIGSYVRRTRSLADEVLAAGFPITEAEACTWLLQGIQRPILYVIRETLLHSGRPLTF